MFLWKILAELLDIMVTDAFILYLKDYFFRKKKSPKQAKIVASLDFCTSFISNRLYYAVKIEKLREELI